MPRSLADDWRAGQLLTWTVVRGKCRFGDNHESVRDVGGEWYGETTNDVACSYAPKDQCPKCDGIGRVAGPIIEMAGRDAQVRSLIACKTCSGTGQVPGPHWPWRWPKPPPLKLEDR